MASRPITRRTSRPERAILIGLLVLVGACASPASPGPGSVGVPTASARESAALPSARTTPSPTAGQSVATSCAEQVLTGMTVAQRIGQLFLLGLADDRLGSAELSAIRNQHVGSVWFTQTSAIGVDGIRAIADAVQAEASPASTAGVGFFVAANQEGGQVQALRGPGFSAIPSAVVQGKQTVAALTAEARRWGKELKAAGVNLDFAPVFDVVPVSGESTDRPIGVLQREYGHTPMTAGSHAAAFVEGMTGAAIATTAKHFPGLGRVVGNTDFSAGVIDDVTTPDDPYLGSFAAAVGAGVPFVMVALAKYTRIDPAHLAAFSPIVIGQLLRRDLGFQGVVMSDDLGATEAVASMPAGDRAIDFLLAGGDLIVSKTARATRAMVAAVQARVATEKTFAERVDDATLHVLTAKQNAGLLPCPG